MRRLWWLLIILILALTSCDEIESLLPEREAETLPSEYIAPTPESRFPADTSTATRIQSRGRMIVGVRYDLEPLSYITSESDVVGLEIDLARELARRWLGNPDAVEFRQVRSDTAYEHLASGTIDFALAGLIHTQNAEAHADFGPPYFMDGHALLTFPDTGIQSVEQLSGRRVGVVTWTDGQAALQAHEEITPTYVTYESFFDVVEALRTREIDAYADLHHRLERARRMINGATIVGQHTWAPVAMAYRHDDPFFHNLVALTFRDMAVDGTRDALYARWLPTTSPPTLEKWPGEAATPTLAASPPQRATLDVIGRIRNRGSLSVGYFVDLWPYSADRNDGVPTGFEVRLVERMAELWLGSRQAATFIPVTRADAVQRLTQGELDMLVGNWVHTQEAELSVDFSVTVLNDGVSFFSLAATPIRTPEDLGGQPLGVVDGSPGAQALPQISQSAGVGIRSSTYPNFAAALEGLNQREVPALLSHRRPALEILYRQVGYFITDRRTTYRPVALMLPQGDSEYRDLVNLTLMTLYDNGVYPELYQLWFDDAVPDLSGWPGHPGISLRISAPAPAEE
jgi:ABC-type amino acid transport substrate-binding protein